MSSADAKFMAIARCLPDDLEGLRRAFRSASDDHAMLDLASMHGLLGVLADALERAGLELAPSLHRTLREQLLLQRLRHERLTQWLGVALAALDGAGIPAVSLKGPVLGARLYRDAVHRPSTDIDLLVRMDDADRAIEALVAAGWSWQDSARERYHREHHHHLHLTRPHVPMIELHIRGLVGFGTELPAEPLLERAVRFASPFGPTWVLTSEDELLYLALHAAGHLCARMAWLYDLARLIEANPALVWHDVEQRARAIGASRALRAALRAVSELDARVPAHLSVQNGWLDQAADQLLMLGQDAQELGPRRTLATTLFNMLASDAPSRALATGAHTLWRVTRRRAQQALPQLLPSRWSA